MTVKEKLVKNFGITPVLYANKSCAGLLAFKIKQ